MTSDESGGVLLQSLQPGKFSVHKVLPKSRLGSSRLPPNRTSYPCDLPKGREGVLCGKRSCCCNFRKSMSSQIFVTTPAKLRLRRSAQPGSFPRCYEVVSRRQRQAAARNKSDKVRTATQCMVPGTVCATDVTSQPLRPQPHHDCATVTT